MTDKKMQEEEVLQKETAAAAEDAAAEAAKEAGAGPEDTETAEGSQETEGSENSEDKAEAPSAEAPTAEEPESERYLRLMAEFQNFKKRAQKEKSDIHAYANEKLIKNLLPVLDNFERALSLDAGSDPEAYAKGMALILEEMKKAMADAGLEELDAEGKDFDPNLHSAVMTEANEELEAGKVSRVFQKGYTLNGRVVRPAMVVVTE